MWPKSPASISWPSPSYWQSRKNYVARQCNQTTKKVKDCIFISIMDCNEWDFLTLWSLKMTVVSDASVVPEWSGVGVAGDDLAPPRVSVPDELVRRLLALSRPDLLLDEGLDLSLWSILLATVSEMIPGVGPWGKEKSSTTASHQHTIQMYTPIPPSAIRPSLMPRTTHSPPDASLSAASSWPRCWVCRGATSRWCWRAGRSGRGGRRARRPRRGSRSSRRFPDRPSRSGPSSSCPSRSLLRRGKECG